MHFNDFIGSQVAFSELCAAHSFGFILVMLFSYIYKEYHVDTSI